MSLEGNIVVFLFGLCILIFNVAYVESREVARSPPSKQIVVLQAFYALDVGIAYTKGCERLRQRD